MSKSILVISLVCIFSPQFLVVTISLKIISFLEELLTNALLLSKFTKDTGEMLEVLFEQLSIVTLISIIV